MMGGVSFDEVSSNELVKEPVDSEFAICLLVLRILAGGAGGEDSAGVEVVFCKRMGEGRVSMAEAHGCSSILSCWYAPCWLALLF